MSKFSRVLLLISLGTMLVAMNSCTSTPELQQGASAEVTFDGLVRVDNTGWDRAWADPSFDISSYEEIIFGGTEIQYRPIPRASRFSSRISSQVEFAISEEDRVRLEAIVLTEFSNEFANISNFKIATNAGPSTLLLKITLSDVTSNFPPENLDNRFTYLSRVGSARLTVELADSDSHTILARMVDRQAPQFIVGELQLTNSVTAWVEVRLLSSRWARLIRRRIDEMAVAR